MEANNLEEQLQLMHIEYNRKKRKLKKWKRSAEARAHVQQRLREVSSKNADGFVDSANNENKPKTDQQTLPKSKGQHGKELHGSKPENKDLCLSTEKPDINQATATCEVNIPISNVNSTEDDKAGTLVIEDNSATVRENKHSPNIDDNDTPIKDNIQTVTKDDDVVITSPLVQPTGKPKERRLKLTKYKNKNFVTPLCDRQNLSFDLSGENASSGSCTMPNCDVFAKETKPNKDKHCDIGAENYSAGQVLVLERQIAPLEKGSAIVIPQEDSNSCDSILSNSETTKSSSQGESSSILSSDSKTSDSLEITNGKQTYSRRRSGGRKRRISSGEGPQRRSSRLSNISSQDSSNSNDTFLSPSTVMVNKKSIILSSVFQCLVDEGKRQAQEEFSIDLVNPVTSDDSVTGKTVDKITDKDSEDLFESNSETDIDKPTCIDTEKDTTKSSNDKNLTYKSTYTENKPSVDTKNIENKTKIGKLECGALCEKLNNQSDTGINIEHVNSSSKDSKVDDVMCLNSEVKIDCKGEKPESLNCKLGTKCANPVVNNISGKLIDCKAAKHKGLNVGLDLDCDKEETKSLSVDQYVDVDDDVTSPTLFDSQPFTEALEHIETTAQNLDCGDAENNNSCNDTRDAITGCNEPITECNDRITEYLDPITVSIDCITESNDPITKFNNPVTESNHAITEPNNCITESNNYPITESNDLIIESLPCACSTPVADHVIDDKQTSSNSYLKSVSSFKVASNEHLHSVCCGEVTIDDTDQLFVVCLCSTCLKLYMYDDNNVWTSIDCTTLPYTVRKKHINVMYMLNDSEAINIILLEPKTNCTVIYCYSYNGNSWQQTIVDTIFCKSLHICPLQNTKMAVGYLVDRRTYLNRYFIDTQSGQWSHVQIGYTDSHVTGLMSVTGIESALVVLTETANIQIWNHDHGLLLTNIDLSDVCPKKPYCPQVFSEQGFLFLPIISGKKGPEAGSVIVVNPYLGTSETITPLTVDSSWTGSSRVSMMSSGLMVSRQNNGCLRVWNIYTGQLVTSVNNISNIFTQGKHLVLVHEQCVHMYALSM